MATIEIQSADGHRLSAYRAEPAQAPVGGLVVIQEIFGVNAHIRAVTDRFAEAGFLAIAPAIFDRVEPGVELGYEQADMKRGIDLVNALNPETMLMDVAAAVAVAAAAGKVGTVGYCFGGAVVWVAAARLGGLACAVSYYGSRIVRYADEAPKVPVMMHVGKHDTSLSLEKVHEIGRRYSSVVIHEYDAGHGFNCTERRDFRPEAAALALERSVDFLSKHLAGK